MTKDAARVIGSVEASQVKSAAAAVRDCAGGELWSIALISCSSCSRSAACGMSSASVALGGRVRCPGFSRPALVTDLSGQVPGLVLGDDQGGVLVAAVVMVQLDLQHPVAGTTVVERVVAGGGGVGEEP